MRVVIELVPENEAAEADVARSERRAWLTARGYRPIQITAAEVESDLTAFLSQLVTTMQKCR